MGNRFDPSKRWVALEFKPGRRLQQPELDEIQSLALHRDKRLGDAIFGSGHVLDGCQLYITSNKKSVKITAGSVYVDGIIHDVPETTLAITGVGEESIGLKIDYQTITYEQDPSLLDPNVGYDNFGLPGADRKIANTSWVVNDDAAIKIFRLSNGQPITQVAPPELEGFNPILARRTYDESGNYMVRGFGMWAKNYDATRIELSVEPGKAYVMGFERVLTASTKILLNKALDTRTVLNEPKVFATGTNLYKLNNKPVKKINRLVGVVQLTQNITRGNVSGGSDLLPKTPVVSIVSVSQGGTTYNQGVDYQLTNNSVDWSLSGIEPAIGTTYSVTWRYNKQMVLDTDFKLTASNGEYYVDFSPAGDDPVNGSTFQVDYDFYLARKDLVAMDKEGKIIIIAGQSDIEQFVVPPKVSASETLPLGTIMLPPNSDSAVVNKFSIVRYSMEDIQKLVKRIEDIEYNQAVEGLDNEAMQGESPTNLKGIFTDSFATLGKADTTFPGFTLGYDLDRGEITLRADDFPHELQLNQAATTANRWENVATGKVAGHVPIISQEFATESMLVNPYAVYNRVTLTSVNPPVDNWIEQSTIVVEEREVINTTLRRWWYHQGASWAEEERRRFEELGAGDLRGWDGYSGVQQQVLSDRILDESIMYMRQKELVITGSNYEPNADSLEGYFDGQPVALQPLDGTLAGTAPGSIRANASGKFKCSFVIPAGTRTGTRLITIANANNEGNCTYQAEGRKQVTETTVLTREVHIKPVDPLAQSFSVPQNCFVSRVGLYFTSKDVTAPAIVQIRNMVNGFPGREVLAQKLLEPTDITASAKADVETVVSFDSPSFCKAEEQYCIVVLSHSNVYALGVAELGKQDLKTGAWVTRQPYVVGVLFSSSNALTWTDHQAKDMKFKIYACTFQPTSVLEFEPWTPAAGTKFDRLLLVVDDFLSQGTNALWEVSINDGAYTPIAPYAERELSFLAEKVKVRATLLCSKYLTPVVNLSSPNMIGFKNALTAKYVSRLVNLSQEYTTVRQIIDLAVPSGSAITVKFSTDDGATWITPSTVTTEKLDQVFTRYSFSHTLGAPATTFRAMLEMTSNSQLVRPRAKRFLNIIK